MLAVAAIVFAGNLVIKDIPKNEKRGSDIVLLDSMGGDIFGFAYNFAGWKRLGLRVIVSGMCASSCTLVLANPKACADPKSILGFHLPVKYRISTGEVFDEVSEEGKAIMWSAYPDSVKARLGELTRQMVYMRGVDVLPACLDYP
jgi:hypothetical protein